RNGRRGRIDTGDDSRGGHDRLRDARSCRSASHCGTCRRLRSRARRRRRGRASVRGKPRAGSSGPGRGGAMVNDVLRMTGEHLMMVLISVAAAIVAGVPLGVWCTRRARAGGVALRIVDAIQTIPSLALFGFLIPVPYIGGIGMRTAILALILYSLLPIVRNTVTGIRGVDPNVRDAGVAMGFTPRQL